MKRRIFFIIGLVISIGLFCGLAIPAILNSDDVYSGKVVFYSENDYAKFKEELNNSDAKWTNEDMQILSSAPPIIAKFSVRINQDYQFLYGEKTSGQKTEVLILSTFFIALLVVCYCVVSSSWEKTNWLWLFHSDKVNEQYTKNEKEGN